MAGPLWVPIVALLSPRPYWDIIILLIDNLVLSTEDIKVVKILSAKLRAHFSKESYEVIRCAFAQEIGLPSKFVAWGRVCNPSSLKSAAYDCCVNSCCAFLSKYRPLLHCPFCNKAWNNSKGKPQNVFHDVPLIPQLQALFQQPDLVHKLLYRADQQATYSLQRLRDVFDGAHFRSLLKKQVRPSNPYRFFQDDTDLALSLSLDGFSLFNHRRRGNSTAWPLLILNYNLPPDICTHLEHVICIGAIPGPNNLRIWTHSWSLCWVCSKHSWHLNLGYKPITLLLPSPTSCSVCRHSWSWLLATYLPYLSY